MSNLTIKVEVLAGTDISEAIQDMMKLRIRTGTNVSTNFNGTHVFICRDDQQVDDLVAKYHAELKHGNGYVA